MADHGLCPRCLHANPPENRFCGSCGASLEVSSDLVERREDNPRVIGHALPAKLGPVGKALALALMTLAAQVGLSWLRHRTKAEDQTSTLSAQEVDAAMSESLLGQSVEEILIQEVAGGYWSRVSAWRAVHSFVVTQPTDKRR
jgi:hypothetical protein